MRHVDINIGVIVFIPVVGTLALYFIIEVSEVLFQRLDSLHGSRNIETFGKSESLIKARINTRDPRLGLILGYNVGGDVRWSNMRDCMSSQCWKCNVRCEMDNGGDMGMTRVVGTLLAFATSTTSLRTSGTALPMLLLVIRA